jgi:transposase
MAYSYRPVDRSQRFLLPPDICDWLPEGHLVWLVLDVVDRLDTSGLHRRHPNVGVGRRAYDPDMLLGLLIYSYCMGVRSSRQVERLCHVDVAYRVICANDIPDHSTIARFGQDHDAAAKKLFVDVLAVCASAGLARVGVVAVDGTKMAGNASMRVNRGRGEIEAEVAAMFAQADLVDEQEDRSLGSSRGDELPEGLSDRGSRRARLDAALAVLESQEAVRRAEEETAVAARKAAADEAAARGEAPAGRPVRGDELRRAEAALERAWARLLARRVELEARAAAQGRSPSGPPLGKGAHIYRYEQRLERAKQKAAAGQDCGQVERRGEQKVNLTDPDSRIMKTADGWLQGYNAQAAVSADGLILAAEVTSDQNDLRQCRPMMAATVDNLGAARVTESVGTVLFDAGYLSESNITAPGPQRLIATTKGRKLRQAAKDSGYRHGDPPKDATPIEVMEHQLLSEPGVRLYGMRQHIVEPVFGHAKHNRGFFRFTRRGLAAVDAEWKLIAATHNLLKLHHHGGYPLAAT